MPSGAFCFTVISLYDIFQHCQIHKLDNTTPPKENPHYRAIAVCQTRKFVSPFYSDTRQQTWRMLLEETFLAQVEAPYFYFSYIKNPRKLHVYDYMVFRPHTPCNFHCIFWKKTRVSHFALFKRFFTLINNGHVVFITSHISAF